MKIQLCILLGGLVAAWSLAQVAEQRLYDGALSVKAQKISLKAWGNGGIRETKEMPFQGAQSIRVSSNNFFQGGTFDFLEPKDLAAKFDEKLNVLRVTFLIADAATISGLTSKSKGSGEENLGLTTVRHAASLNSNKRGELKITPTIPFKPKIKKIRMVVLTTDGKKSETYIPVYMTVAAGNGWRSLAVPLPTITGLDRTNKVLKALTLSTDTISTLYIGDVRVVNDTTPLTGEIVNASRTLKWGSELTLSARGDGGDSPLVYSWDFDDRDGIQSDAEGQVVKYKFRKTGQFKVTLTISDYYSTKPPVQKVLSLQVVR